MNDSDAYRSGNDGWRIGFVMLTAPEQREHADNAVNRDPHPQTANAAHAGHGRAAIGRHCRPAYRLTPDRRVASFVRGYSARRLVPGTARPT